MQHKEAQMSTEYLGDVTNMDWEEIERRIEQHTGKKIKYPACTSLRPMLRNSVLIDRCRLIFREDIENRLAKIM